MALLLLTQIRTTSVKPLENSEGNLLQTSVALLTPVIIRPLLFARPIGITLPLPSSAFLTLKRFQQMQYVCVYGWSLAGSGVSSVGSD
jgi:hypothetical protein